MNHVQPEYTHTLAKIFTQAKNEAMLQNSIATGSPYGVQEFTLPGWLASMQHALDTAQEHATLAEVRSTLMILLGSTFGLIERIDANCPSLTAGIRV